MKILLIDTCGTIGSLAFADAVVGGSMSVLASAELPARSASERLAAEVRRLAGEAELGIDQVGAIAVVNGPGSFTGVRVGASLVKGLAEAVQARVLAISRLAVLAHMAGDSVGTRIAALLDAGRGEFYCGIYDANRRVREALLTKEEAVAAAAGTRVVACETCVREALAELQPLSVAEPRAQHALAIAVRRIAAGEFDDVAALDANYLRRTDAEMFAQARA